MAAAQRAVLQAEHGVKMEAGLTVIALRDIAEQAQHLALLADFDRLVYLGHEIEPADLRMCESADCRDRGTRDLLPTREFGNGFEGLFALIQYQHKHALGAVIDRLRFHPNILLL